MRKSLAVIVAIIVCFVASGPLFAGSSDTEQGTALYTRRGKWIEVVIAEQRLTAWENGRAVMSTPVSTGARRTPTPRGTFRIYSKYAKQRMRGPDYDLPNVPYVMYFRQGGYALHGAYWHTNFGQPRSHGCVNLPISAAAWLYHWAPRGTLVVIR